MIPSIKTLPLFWLTLCALVICALPLDARAQTTVQMTKAGGVYMMPCKVNGLALRFIIDTGASDVSISATEALFMLKNGYLSENDFIGEASYRTASGDIMKGSVVVFRQLEIGGIVLRNVTASVSHTIDAPLLLGQSALQQLGTVSFDYANNTVTFGGGVASSNDGNTYRQPVARPAPAVAPKGNTTIVNEPLEKRFLRSPDGVITDPVTNLQWLIGPDRDTTYDVAQSWVASQNGGWRLPTRQELKTLYNPSFKKNLNISPLIFKVTSGYLWVWAEPRDSSSAWGFLFYDGTDDWIGRDYSNYNRVFAVRPRR